MSDQSCCVLLSPVEGNSRCGGLCEVMDWRLVCRAGRCKAVAALPGEAGKVGGLQLGLQVKGFAVQIGGKVESRQMLMADNSLGFD